MSDILAKIINRTDSANHWNTVNPVLEAGEIGFEVDTNKFKIGDGQRRWRDLPYKDGSTYRAGSGISIVGDTISVNNGVIATRDYVNTTIEDNLGLVADQLSLI